jgi:lysophospholipase L1-like esterase
LKKINIFYIACVLLLSSPLLPAAVFIKTRTMPVTIKTDTTHTWLALGDSYTIGESVPEKDRYPVQTVALLKAQGINFSKATIIATTGWTTQNLLDAIKNKPVKPVYTIVSLLIGVNNQYQGRSLEEYKEQFRILLQHAIELADNKASHVFVLSIPDYSVTPFARQSDQSKIAMEIDLFNSANRQIADQFKVNYINITTTSRRAATDPSLVASDGLHFSGKAYLEWSQLLTTLIKQAFQ